VSNSGAVKVAALLTHSMTEIGIAQELKVDQSTIRRSWIILDTIERIKVCTFKYKSSRENASPSSGERD
jgi:hypothetical protein